MFHVKHGAYSFSGGETMVYNVDEKSPYKYFLDGYTYYFSTNLHRNNFVNKYMENRREVNTRLYTRYRVKVRFDLLADLYLYKKIENRGFFIEDSRGGINEWDILLSGERLTNSVLR